MRLYESERPRRFFSIIAGLLMAAALVLAIPVFVEYAETGLVPRIPTAVLSASLALLASLSFFAGSILETVTKGRQEVKRLAYLAQQPPGPAVPAGPAAAQQDQSSRSRRNLPV